MNGNRVGEGGGGVTLTLATDFVDDNVKVDPHLLAPPGVDNELRYNFHWFVLGELGNDQDSDEDSAQDGDLFHSKRKRKKKKEEKRIEAQFFTIKN